MHTHTIYLVRTYTQVNTWTALVHNEKNEVFLIRQKVLNIFNSVYEEISKRTVGIEKEKEREKSKNLIITKNAKKNKI